MSEFTNDFREKTSRWFTTEDGLAEYRVCAITAAQGTDALDALFDMAGWKPLDSDKVAAAAVTVDPAAAPTEEELLAELVTSMSDNDKAERKRRIKILVRAGLLAARLGGKEYPAPPVDEIPGAHLGEIARAINGCGIPSKEEADDAKVIL